MKTLLLPACTLLIAVSITFSSCKKTENPESPAPGNTAPALLSAPQTGQAYTGTINDFTLAYNGSHVVLLAVQNSTGKIYAIDLKDGDASKAAANTVTAPVADFRAKIAASMGVAANLVRIVNMEVNPLSKSIYVLARNTQNNNQSVFKVTNAGNTVELLDVSNVSYSTITYSTSGHLINDITWGDNTLYFSFSNASTLNGEVAALKAPFAHNTTVTSRATTVFKSNWGGSYFTDAPLESLTYGEVDGEKRLMGVTVCAPGFSFKTSDINGTGMLQVKEYFNLNTGMADKVFTINNNGTTYLYEVHFNGRIVRIGEKFINESQTANVQNGYFILTFSGTPANGLTEEDVKVIASAGTYVMAAKYTNTQLLVVTGTGQLELLNL